MKLVNGQIIIEGKEDLIYRRAIEVEFIDSLIRIHTDKDKDTFKSVELSDLRMYKTNLQKCIIEELTRSE